MINYYTKLIISKAIVTIPDSSSKLTCEIITDLCYEHDVEKEYREELLNDWRRYCQHEVWFNIDEPIFIDGRVEKMKQYLDSK